MQDKEIILKGIPAAPGITVGKAFVLGSEQYIILKRHIKEDEIASETKRFKDCLLKTKSEILDIKKKMQEEIGVKEAQIFGAHLLVLEDSMLIDEVISRLSKDKLSVEYVFQDVLKKYIKIFSEMDDEYLRERISDINDVGKRILRHLIGAKAHSLSDISEKAIVIAYDISPSDTAAMHKTNVIGFATDIGGRTSHTAIMAKSLEIPAVVGLEIVTQKIKDGDELIIDGTHGTVIIHPTAKTYKKYTAARERIEVLEKCLGELRDLPCVTLDGKEIDLAANIELPEEVLSVIAHGARGIGLYRTEFMYMNRRDLPSEEEQFKAYSKVAKKMKPHPVIIRTVDLGGDKFLSPLEIPEEMNPFMGWRAIRFCLAQPDIFKVQLRAILRASAYGKLRLMYPMISGIQEFKAANQILEDVKKSLTRDSIQFDEDIEVGAMIEIPSAALTSDVIAQEADFFSIGTNDLIQYVVAADRVNEKIAYLYEPSHPGVMRLIRIIIENGHAAGIRVGMCGEMAADATMALVLLGLGLDGFSVSPIAVSEVKKVIRSVTIAQAKEISAKALTFTTGEEVEKFCRQKLKELVPELVVGIE